MRLRSYILRLCTTRVTGETPFHDPRFDAQYLRRSFLLCFESGTIFFIFILLSWGQKICPVYKIFLAFFFAFCYLIVSLFKEVFI